MPISTKRPPRKETVGAQYVCFNTMTEENEWTEAFEEMVEKTEVVKSVKVTENAETGVVYGSGKVYDSDADISSVDVEVEVIAFPDDTLAKMRGDLIDEGGLILSGGKRKRPYFAYGKAVHMKGGKVRYDWYPKCQLTENTDEASTSEGKPSEQTDTIKISAYPFNDDGDISAKVSSGVNFPTGLTEEKWFAKPILTKGDLGAAIANTATQSLKAASTKKE